MSALILVGCGKSKRPHTSEARDLYTGNLFRARRTYAEAQGHPWLILSALHGLIEPAYALDPYDVTMCTKSNEEKNVWTMHVVLAELHAGEHYSRKLRAALASLGVQCTWPVEGMGIGEQLAFYAARRA